MYWLFYYLLFIIIMTLPVSKLIIKYLLHPYYKGNTSTVYFNNYYLYSGENILCYIVPFKSFNKKYKSILFINYRFINSIHIKFLLTYINSNKGLCNKFFIYYMLNIPYSFKGVLSFESILLNTEKYLYEICCNNCNNISNYSLLLNSEIVHEYCILFKQFNYLYKYYYKRNCYYKLRIFYSYCLNKNNSIKRLQLLYYKVKILSNIK